MAKAKTLVINGEEHTLLPVAFVEKIGAVIMEENKFTDHFLTIRIYDMGQDIVRRGIFDKELNNGEGYYALTVSEIKIFKEEYNKAKGNII